MKNIFMNLSLLTIAELIEKAIIFLIFIYMGRLLDPKDFGQLNFLLALMAYIAIFIDFGMPYLSTRELASHPHLNIPIFRLVISIKLMISILVMILWTIYSLYANVENLLMYLFFNLYIFSRVVDFYWYLQAQQKFTDIAKLKLFKATILLSSFGLLIVFPAAFSYIVVLTLSLIIPFVYYSCKNELYGIVKKDIFLAIRHPRRVIIYLTKAFSFAATGILMLMYFNLDTLLIKYFLGYKEVAQYNAAYKIIFAFIVLRSVFTSVIFPRLSNTKYDWKEGKFFLGIGVAMAFFIFMSIYIWSEQILNLAYAGKYNDSSVVFVILAAAASTMWINLYFPTFFVAIKKDGFYLRVHFFTAMLNLFGNIILIPKYGIVGAAVATLLADIVSLIIFGVAYFKLKTEKGQS